MNRVAKGVLFVLSLTFVFSLAANPVADKLSPENRLAIVRALASEFVILQVPLPLSQKEKEAVRIKSTGEINQEQLRNLLAKRGVAAESGDSAQITAMKIKRDHILFEINGGGPRGKKWYERITISGGAGSVQPRQRQRSSGDNQLGWGTWVRLDFDGRIPDITPEDVKQMLASVFSFGQKSPITPWIETIPEEFRKAIEERRAMVGMDRDMVLAAMDRPLRKVREMRDGVEYEDWLYGNPPFVTFVVFQGDTVVEVKEFK